MVGLAVSRSQPHNLAPSSEANLSKPSVRHRLRGPASIPSNSGHAGATVPVKIFGLARRGLSREQSATYLGISHSKFDQLRKDGRIGPPRLIDGRKVWDVHRLDEDFEAFPIEGNGLDEGWDVAL